MFKALLTTLNAKYIHTNLAIRILYERNHKQFPLLDWKEHTIKEDFNEVAQSCAKYDVVAFSCYIWNIEQTLEVAKRIKAISPNTHILLGGPEVSYENDSIIQQPYIDSIIEGEGEIPFQQFLHSYPIIDENIESLVWKKDNIVLRNPSKSKFDVLELADAQPYQFDNTEELKNKVLYIETSRGCPYKCEFCLASLDNKVRYLPMQSIKNTLLFMMQHGKVVKFLDRTFNVKKDFTIEIFQFILDHHQPGNVFQFEITADILHPDIIRFIHEKVPVGLFRFEIGIQSVNQKANLEVSRKQNFEKTKSIIEQVRDHVEMHLDLIVGLPLDYWDDVKHSFEEVFKLFAPELQLGFLKFLKGTPVREKSQLHDYKFHPTAPYQIIESKYLSAEELRKIEQLEHMLEICWNSKKAINTMKYVCTHYSIFDYLIGLGEYWNTHTSFVTYSLDDVFMNLSAFSKQYLPDDAVIHTLIAIDYYSHFKIKPKDLLSCELDKSSKNKLIEQQKLNHHKYRHVVLSLPFSYEAFQVKQQIIPQQQQLIFEYNGISKPSILSHVD